MAAGAVSEPRVYGSVRPLCRAACAMKVTAAQTELLAGQRESRPDKTRDRPTPSPPSLCPHKI